MEKIYKRPESLKNVRTTFCPGCGHGIIHKLIAEVIDEMNLREKTILVAPVGCAVFGYDYFNFDVAEAPHGRTPAVASAIKRVLPDRLVISYQGDGDLMAIGTGEIIHTANRGEKITVIFVNNAIYGMTGGQMAPTTLVGQKSTTTPKGRDPKTAGYPIKVCELLSNLPGAVYLERCAVNKPKNVILLKKAIRKAFEIQLKNIGFTLIEILSHCPVNWHLPPKEAVKWVDEYMIPYFPLGIIKDTTN
jgi:2-oxoglutarate ferredoxin oxidoreductase subunit beta